MATLSLGGRISVDLVAEEIERLNLGWAEPLPADNIPAHLEIDLFDRAQLSQVLDVCRRSRTLSEAGRTLFNASRGRKTSTNDADRLRKYLARFGLEWGAIKSE